MSERISNNQLHRSLIRHVNDTSRNLMEIREQLSTGRKLTKPSDDPLKTARSLELLSEADNLGQYDSNIRQAASWTQVSETALDKVSDLVSRARTLVLQAANDTLSFADRQKIAAEIDGIVDSVKSQGNTRLGQEYIFAGTASTTPPYQLGVVDTYIGNTGSIVREIAPGVRVNVNEAGINVFGDATTGLIQNLRDIQTRLNSGVPADLDIVRTTGLQSLDSSISTILTARTRLGEMQSRFEFNLDRLGTLKDSTMDLLSNIRDTDYAEASVIFATRQAAFEAALKTGKDLVMPSLVDFVS